MGLSREYWALHHWLFNAYLLGKDSPRAIDMCMLFGPDWRETEADMATELMAEMMRNDPGMREYVSKKVLEKVIITE